MKKDFHILLCFAVCISAFAQTTLTLRPDSLLQVITGWEATSWIGQPNDSALPYYKDSLLNLAVNDIGINRIRLEIRSGVENDTDYYAIWAGRGFPESPDPEYYDWRYHRYATKNDDDNPNSINWAGFHFTELDWTVENIVIPLRQRCKANGESLYINLNYVAFTGQIQGGSYHHDNPDEYAEFVLVVYQHMQNKYGFVPNAWEPVLEPDNVSQWNGNKLGQAIAAASARLSANGFTPRFIAPSNTNMANAITWFDEMIKVSGVLNVLEEISYHLYSGVSDANLQAIAARAVQYNKKTSMLEWWTDANDYQLLHKHLTMGRNSAYQQFVLRGLFDLNLTNPQKPVISLHPPVKFTRQYYKYVRMGAQRIHAVSSNSGLKPLAFISKNGTYIVVVNASNASTFSVQGLPAGAYGIKYTTSSQYDMNLPDKTISAGQTLSTNIPAAGVITLYQKTGGIRINQHKSHQNPPALPVVFASWAPSIFRIFMPAETSNPEISIYRIDGGLKRKFSGSPNGILTWDARSTAAGIYLLSGKAWAGQWTQKIELIK